CRLQEKPFPEGVNTPATKLPSTDEFVNFIEADRQTAVLAFWTKRTPMAWRRPSAAKATHNGIGQTTNGGGFAADRTALRKRQSAVRLAYTATGGRRWRARRHHSYIDIYALK